MIPAVESFRIRADMIADPQWLLELTRQLAKLRFIAAGGLLKNILRLGDEKDEDLLLLIIPVNETFRILLLLLSAI